MLSASRRSDCTENAVDLIFEFLCFSSQLDWDFLTLAGKITLVIGVSKENIPGHSSQAEGPPVTETRYLVHCFSWVLG